MSAGWIVLYRREEEGDIPNDPASLAEIMVSRRWYRTYPYTSTAADLYFISGPPASNGGGLGRKESEMGKTYTKAYPMAKYLAAPSLAPKSKPEDIVDNRRPIERYEMKVRSFANQTLASTLTGVAIFSVFSRQRTLPMFDNDCQEMMGRGVVGTYWEL